LIRVIPYGENNPSDITISALQRGVWQANDGRIVSIFVNISDQNINFKIPDPITGKINKLSNH
jgi:hypothetical protein